MSELESSSPKILEESPRESLAGVRPGISEDWLAVIIGGMILAICLSAVWLTADSASEELVSPLKGFLAKPGEWIANPLAGLGSKSLGILGAFAVTLVGFGSGVAIGGQDWRRFAQGFVPVFLLALFAYILSGQQAVKSYSLEYALWALMVGLLISNTIGTPQTWKPGVRTEFYMKVGLVLLGAEVLLGLLLKLGMPGVFIAWVVTPIVLITTFWFGQKVLKIPSASLNMVISADMSVCGVSAAIATAGACKAKKEELSLAIGISLSFTVIMMVVMPMLVGQLGLGPILGGAWIGGTIDATGAVGAAGEMLGAEALVVATTIKMIQNILIGVVAFCVALYWVVRIESGETDRRPDAMEIWRRFPKFVIGFIFASLVFTVLRESLPQGELIVSTVIKDSTKVIRGWCFCLAFVSIGLETNFRSLAHYLRGGKPLVLYVCGQTLNLCLTLFMAWLMFFVVFPDAADALAQ